MGRKKRRTPGTTNKGRKRSGNPARNASKKTLAPGSTTQELDRLLRDFVRWHDVHGGGTDTRLALARLTAFYFLYTKTSSIKSVTAIDPQLMIQLLAMLLSLNQDQAVKIARTLHVFLHFLRQSGRWSGTYTSYLETHAILQAVGSDDPQLVPDPTT